MGFKYLLDRGSIRSSLKYGLGTPFRLAFYNCQTWKIDDVCLEHGGLTHVLLLAVHLRLPDR